jgi:hypothetical protein
MSALRGPSTSLWIRSGGSWLARTAADKFNSIGSWVQPKVLYRATTTFDTVNNVWVTTWVPVCSFIIPSVAVPGGHLGKAPAVQVSYGADVTWTIIAADSDDRKFFSVKVDFVNETTSEIYTVFVDQSVGGARSKAWSQLDTVHAVLTYVNDNGDGPSTSTNSVVLGP